MAIRNKLKGTSKMHSIGSGRLLAKCVGSLVRLSIVAALGLAAPLAICAAEHTVSVRDQLGEPLEYAVVEILYDQASAPQAPPAGSLLKDVEQKNLTFVPFVSAVPAGAEVRFPNLDKTRHHVYSFSEAKAFELQLFVGHNHDPVRFDKPGIVVIGCNIHDYMQAYIYVAASDHVAVTDSAGSALLAPMPEHAYAVKVWHPWANGDAQVVQVEPGAPIETIEIAVTRQPLPAPPQGGMQELFRR